MIPLFRITGHLTGTGRRMIWPALIATMLIAGLALAAVRWAGTHARTISDAAAMQAARANAGLLTSELQKFRLLPLVLMEYPDVSAVLNRPNPAAVARLNATLELLATRTDAAVIYVIRNDGVTIAASNWRLPTSFVGYGYGYRPYFTEAMHKGAAEFFALGAVSGNPGLFIAQRVDRDGRPLGVIVVKVDFGRLESAWARQQGPTIVTDQRGVVIITNREEWRYRTLGQLSPAALAAVKRTHQFGNLTLRPLALIFTGAEVTQAGGGPSYRAAAVGVPLAGGTLRFLQPLAPAEASANASARAAILAGVIVVVLLLGYLLRARERRRMQHEARRTLEREVALRTAELTEANGLLRAESREREQADLRFRAAREEVHQANRLASIGQITAGVAHEINQPVAAIRTFAENALAFLHRGNTGRVQTNLDHIIDLTSRIGAITGELRSFARRGAQQGGATNLAAMIDGALLLFRDRMRSDGIRFDRVGELGDLAVKAERVRVEQVLINLLQNAIEALEGKPDPRIRLSVARGKETVTVELDDNGSGIEPALAGSIFTPFVTGRPQGLGLGLGIARDIAREFGGELLLIPSTLGGAAFRLTLRPA